MSLVSLRLNKVYKPIIEKILEYDDLKKIETIYEFGKLGSELYDRYSNVKDTDVLNIEQKMIFDEKLKKVKSEYDERMMAEQDKFNSIMNEWEKDKVEKERYYDNRNEETKNRYINEISQLKEENNTITSKYYNFKKEVEENYDDIIKSKEIEISNMSKKIVELELQYKRDNEVVLKEQLEKLKDEKNREIQYFKELVEKNADIIKETFEGRIKNIVSEFEGRIETLTKENEAFKEKYGKTELNSVLKGKPYEDIIESELTAIFIKRGDSWIIKNRSDIKGKGDFLVINKYSGIRIMIEAKNMPVVSSTVPNQQPKFLKNLLDKTNNYDGGIIITRGRVEKKYNYQIDVIQNKVATYIENYEFNDAERIYLILEVLHGKIFDIKNNTELSKDSVLEELVKRYNVANDVCKKMEVCYMKQKDDVNDLKNYILTVFNVDVDEISSNVKSKNNMIVNSVEDEVREYIKNLLDSDDNNGTMRELKNNVNKRFENYIKGYNKKDKIGISKNKVSVILREEYNQKYENNKIIIETK
jgi:hypothetical protein